MQPASQNPLIKNTILGSKYFDPGYLFSQASHFFQQVWSFISSDNAIILEKTLLFFLATFFIAIICYVAVRMFEIREKEHAYLRHEIAKYAHDKAEYEKRLHEVVGGSKNPHWGKTLDYLFSQHGSDWKLAIIEADTMLDGLLSQLGFAGESLGDKLKSANQENFPQLSTAWEVHTIRNRIAHEGLTFEMTQHEAKRVIALYEQIFHAYGYI